MFTDFEYADKRLSDFGWIIGYIDNAPGVSEVDIGTDITFNAVKNNHSSIRYETSTSYEDIYIPPSFEIFKNPCGKNQEDMYISDDEVSVMTKWLNRHGYRKFKPIYNSDNSDIHYYGSFNVKKKKINDRVVGLILTFNSNAPYGFGERIINEFILDNTNKSFVICGSGDEYTTVYPNVFITCKEKGDLRITNITTGEIFEVLGCSENEIIYVNGEHKYINSSNEEHKNTTLFNDFNYNYLNINMMADDDFHENVYEVSISCEIRIDYSPIRKVGI